MEFFLKHIYLGKLVQDLILTILKLEKSDLLKVFRKIRSDLYYLP